MRSLFGDNHSEKCSTIPTEFDFDAQLFTSGVYRRYVLVTQPSFLWNGARSVERDSLEDEYDDNSTIRTNRDAEMIRDQTTGTSIQTDIGAFEIQYENGNSATDMPKKDVMLHKQPSLEWGENLMRSLDYVAKEAIEMKIAESDRTAIEVFQLNITASEDNTAYTKFIGPDKVAERASIGTHSNEPGNEESESGDLSLPMSIPFTSIQDAVQIDPELDIDEDEHLPCKGCGEVSQ